MAAAPRARVLVLGDVMLDEYAWGDVGRISPEAPVPVVDLRERTWVPGGAANVAHGIVALGAAAVLAGVVGEDREGDVLRDSLAEHGIDAAGVLVTGARRTTVKTRVIARTQQVVRIDQEDRGELDAATATTLLERVEAALAGVDLLVISDYAKGVVSTATAQAAIAAARERGCPVVVDPKGLDFERYRGASIITPNLREAESAMAFEARDDDAVVELTRRVAAALPGTRVLITLGSGGMLLFADGEATRFPVAAREVHDVTGAGDTVVATLAVELAAGATLPDAVRVANRAAAIAVAHVGAVAVTLAELQAADG